MCECLGVTLQEDIMEWIDAQNKFRFKKNKTVDELSTFFIL